MFLFFLLFFFSFLFFLFLFLFFSVFVVFIIIDFFFLFLLNVVVVYCCSFSSLFFFPISPGYIFPFTSPGKSAAASSKNAFTFKNNSINKAPISPRDFILIKRIQKADNLLCLHLYDELFTLNRRLGHSTVTRHGQGCQAITAVCLPQKSIQMSTKMCDNSPRITTNC